MKRALLLDFDGVVLRHKYSDKIVISRIEKFVSRYIKVNPSTLSKINKDIYTSTGHTVLGLQNLGFDANIEEFNEYVYGRLNYDFLFNNIRRTHEKDIRILIGLKEYCDKNDVALNIFSNAPKIWCDGVLSQMSEELLSMNNIENIIGKNVLKPGLSVYSIIEKKLHFDKFYFVDDKFANFMPVYNSTKWIKILLEERDDVLRKDMIFISCLSRIRDILDDPI